MTVAASVVNVKIASLLLVQHPLPREAACRHGWRLRLFDLIQYDEPQSSSASASRVTFDSPGRREAAGRLAISLVWALK